MPDAPVTFRHGTGADSRGAFEIFRTALVDFEQRTGVPVWSGADPVAIDWAWERFRPLYGHLADTGDRFWIAERNGHPIGYARSILRDGVRELTEFFVLPGEQSSGVGRELLARTFPTEGARYRVIVATSDLRALARYLKAGVYPYASTFSFTRTPETVSVPTDLRAERAADTPDTLLALSSIDWEILGHRRDVDHAWLIGQREGFLYRRDGELAGYGYVSKDWCGPFALLREGDFPAVLAQAETRMEALGAESVVLEVPLTNRAAIDHLLRRDYRLEGWVASVMSDAPFGRFDRYIGTSPPFFL